MKKNGKEGRVIQKEEGRGRNVVSPLKGQSVLVTHAILVGFSIILVFVVVSTFTSLSDQFEDFTVKNEIDQLCFVIKGAAEKIYQPTVYKPQSNTTYGQTDMNLPQQIGGLNYRASFENTSVSIETLGTRFNTTCAVGFPANYTGVTTGGLTRISFSRNSTGGETIGMTVI